MPGINTVSEAKSISLITSSHRDAAHYHLMELTPDMVQYFEASGSEVENAKGVKRNRDCFTGGEGEENDERNRSSRLCIKGRHSDEAVLCTPTQTFTLREMTQSNSLLLCSLKESEERASDCAIHVRSNVAVIWELTPIVARTGRIAQLLKHSLYYGEEEEDGVKEMKRYTPQQVASIVQASPRELREGIQNSYVILLEGYYRKVASSYLLESLQVLLNHIDLNDYTYEKVPLSSTMSALEKERGMRRELTEAILLRWFGQQKQAEAQSGAGSDEEIVQLNIEEIVRFMGLQLLETQARDSPILLKNFLLEWEKVAGANLSGHTKVEMLKGHYLTFPAPPTQASDSNPTTIQHFASSGLPMEPAMRLQHLFQKREVWTLEELSPFLNEIAVDAKKRDAILLKYARTTAAKIPLPESKLDRKARVRKGITDAPTKTLQLYSARLRYG